MIDAETRAWWHGCWWPHLGHFLRGGPTARRDECPWHDWTSDSLDGGYAPRRMRLKQPLPEHADPEREDRLVFLNMVSPDNRAVLAANSVEFPQGQFLYHRAHGCSLISWWDRTQGDTRGNCYSTFIVEGEHHVDDVITWFPKLFSLQAKRLADCGVQLVCVNQGIP